MFVFPHYLAIFVTFLTLMSDSTEQNVASILADLPSSRKRRRQKSKTKTPIVGKRQKLNSSNPAKISATERANEYGPKHSLIGLINDKISRRCTVCKSEFANTKDTVNKHIKGPRHQKAVLDKEEKKSEKHCYIQTKTAEEGVERRDNSGTEAWCLRVVQRFYKAGIPIHKIDELRDLLEENSNYKLCASTHLMHYTADCLKID